MRYAVGLTLEVEADSLLEAQVFAATFEKEAAVGEGHLNRNEWEEDGGPFRWIHAGLLPGITIEQPAIEMPSPAGV